MANNSLNNNTIDRDITYEHKVSIPYVTQISRKIGNVFKKYNSRVSYCRLKNDIYSKLYNHKSKIHNEMKSGVYKNRLDCNHSYIGETKRYFNKRLEEHKKDVMHNRIERSALASHSLTKSHAFNCITAKVIKTEKMTS